MSLPTWNTPDTRDKPGGWRALLHGGRRPLMRYVAVGGVVLLVLYLFVYSSDGPVPFNDYLNNSLGYGSDPAAEPAGAEHGGLPEPPKKPVDNKLPYPAENGNGGGIPPVHDGDDESYGSHSSSSSASEALWAARAESVRQGFLHAYHGWEDHAWGKDELLPVTNGSVDNFNGWGVSLFDALDTMLLMNCHDEFDRAIPFVEKSTFLNGSPSAPFFETVIRYLGGLLSAYALSNDPIMLKRADDLGDMLAAAFETQSGFPTYSVTVKANGQSRPGQSGSGVLAEIASCQMEYKYLAHITGKKKYYDAANQIQLHLEEADTSSHRGLWPTHWNLRTGQPTGNKLSIGALADSAYEYMLKQWLMTAHTDRASLDMYLKLMKAIIENLIFISPERKLMYVTDATGMNPSHQHEHLSCYLPALFALGVNQLGPEYLPEADRELHLWAARGLAYTCYVTYADMPTGLGPDEVRFPAPRGKMEDGLWMTHLKAWRAAGSKGLPPGLTEPAPEKDRSKWDYSIKNKGYHLRPETVEALYLVWRATGEEKWRERGWEIWEALEKVSRTKSGYSSVDNVGETPAKLLNKMPSYFLAETVKYLYLLFLDDEILPLNEYVLNTEAHPFPVWNWLPWEVEKFNIRDY